VTALYLYDDERALGFEPFALTRPASELRAGALLVRERWERALEVRATGALAPVRLAGFAERGTPPVVEGGTLPAGAWVANSRFAPLLAPATSADVLVAEGRVAALRLPRAVDAGALDGGATLDSLATAAQRTATIGGWWMDELWDFVRELEPMLQADIPALGAGMKTAVPEGSFRMGTQHVFVEPGAIVEPGVCFECSAGPILVRATARIQAFTRLVGPLYVGEGSILTTDRIEGSSIGDTCKVHGEVNNTIFLGHANKGHTGFVGHSIIGRWVNLGAGTITSNLKNTYGPVHLWTPSGVRDTGMQFLGTMFGDHAKTGIGLRLSTGSVLGAGANVYGNEIPEKVVAPFSWGEAGAYSEFRVDKFLDMAERMMARRDVVLEDGVRDQLRRAHAAKWTVES
jgi:UDP-N-acetylglucosamine diphosphorylase/glucosamine-1-phosphate N-acetyltransferase